MSSRPPEPLAAPSRLTVEFVPSQARAVELARADTLAVFGFGPQAAGDGDGDGADARWLRVPLVPLGTPQLEVWRGAGPVRHGFDAGIAHADDGALQFGAFELHDRAAEDMHAASEQAYARISAFWQRSGFPQVLRIWNYFDDITAGSGDAERYRQFNLGRARGLGSVDTRALPAATAIGSARAQGRVLQVYWLAARQAGTPLENPRQTAAWAYPRQYGAQSPSFARALLPPSAAIPLLISGTASIVGHASRHVDSLSGQIDETLANLDSLIEAARRLRPQLPARFDAGSRLKVYVRDVAQAPRVEQQLRARLGDVPLLLLHGDVCRQELAVEIEAMHGLIMGQPPAGETLPWASSV